MDQEVRQLDCLVDASLLYSMQQVLVHQNYHPSKLQLWGSPAQSDFLNVVTALLVIRWSLHGLCYRRNTIRCAFLLKFAQLESQLY